MKVLISLLAAVCLISGCKEKPPKPPIRVWVVESSFLVNNKTVEVESRYKPVIRSKVFGIGMQQIYYLKPNDEPTSRNPWSHLMNIPPTHTVLIYEKGHRPNTK